MWSRLGLHTSLAESSTAPALLSPDTWGDPELGIDTCWLRLFYHTGGWPALQKQGEFMPLPVHVQGYWCNAVPHFGKQCFSKGGKMLALWEGILLANKHWISSFYFTRDFCQKIRLEGGSLEWFWEALTQKRENDSYYYCYLLRRTDHKPDFLLIFGNLKHLMQWPQKSLWVWTKVFQHKS